ncbi:MAG: DUF2155 domain-containing protein [Pseudomonadota bacterium]
MARQKLAILVATASVLASAPAFAQLPFPNIFDSIFRQEPPRPPGSLPGQPDRLPPGPPPSQQYPGQRGAPQPGVNTQPLPPPSQANLPPAQRTPPAQRPTPQPPPPPEEVIVEPPAQKIANPTAVFSGLDKITGRIINFEVSINETVRFGALEVTPRACFTRPPTENANTDGFIEVDELTLQGELKRIFTGWMFAASPGLNAVEHPIYDVWLTDCKGAPQPVAEAPAEPPPPVPTQRQQRPQQGQSGQQQQPRRANPPPAQQLPPPPAPAR